MKDSLRARVLSRLRGPRRPRTPDAPLKLAFVTPWYGPDIPGGMESQTRRTLKHLRERGVEVEVLTTCIRDFFADWSLNSRPSGVEVVDGIRVHRFPVRPRKGEAFGQVNEKVMAGEALRPSELRIFENEFFKCPALAPFIAAHRDDYDLFVFIPYLYPTTYLAASACPGQAVHIPCLHDEGYARLPPIRQMFAEARGVLFNAPAELRLAQALYGLPDDVCALAGEGVEVGWTGDGERFRARHGLGEYLLYVGRKDAGKNFPLLLECFSRYRQARAPKLSLVVLGPGQTYARQHGLVDLGFVPEADKRDALAGSVALVQPSMLESFSLTVMESWLARRPVMVHGDCDVTKDHCLASDGGLWFRNYPEFAAGLDRLRSDDTLATRMGAKGETYVLENFTWPRVMEKYLRALHAFRAKAWQAQEGRE